MVLRARGRRGPARPVLGITGYDARPPPAAWPTPRHTKWYLIAPEERRALDATPFSDGTKGCSVCHTPLPTEGAFARHYLVPDRHYRNLGECPTKWDG